MTAALHDNASVLVIDDEVTRRESNKWGLELEVPRAVVDEAVDEPARAAMVY